MIEEFDKEIDFLLRQTARGETAFTEKISDSKFQIPETNHLDADEISAFAENALPEKIRQNYIRHLADCERCRKSLANLITFNAAAENEIVHAETPLITAALPKVPWYRQLFAVPNLAYAMGALVLLFAGIGVFTILQNSNSQVSQVSQMSERQIGGKGMSADGDAATQEVYSNRMSSNSAAMNSAASTNSAMNTALPAAPTAAANANTMAMRRELEPTPNETRRDDKAVDELKKPARTVGSAPAAPPPPPASNENDFEVGGQMNESPPIVAQNQPVQNQTQISPDTRNVQRAPMPSARMQKQKIEDSAASGRASLEAKSVVGGKTFTRSNNVWIDAAYRGQATINVSRGTKEYQKLDAGLRGIAENLGGTVIVVWKEKAYRIR